MAFALPVMATWTLPLGHVGTRGQSAKVSGSMSVSATESQPLAPLPTRRRRRDGSAVACAVVCALWRVLAPLGGRTRATRHGPRRTAARAA